jgi:hypothetical protein
LYLAIDMFLAKMWIKKSRERDGGRAQVRVRGHVEGASG